MKMANSFSLKDLSDEFSMNFHRLSKTLQESSEAPVSLPRNSTWITLRKRSTSRITGDSLAVLSVSAETRG